jgi:hypothetical protein
MGFSSSSDIWGGATTWQFIDTVPNPDVTRFEVVGLKSSVPSLDGPKDVFNEYEFADGTKKKVKTGIEGTLKISFEEFDGTDLATLTTYKPGATNGINQIKIIFTELGNGTDHYALISGISSITKAIESGDYWKLGLEITISGAASDEIEDLITFVQP